MNVSQLSAYLSRFLHRFHLTLFVVFVLGGLSLVTLFLNHAITAKDDTPAQTTEQAFDEAAMKRINDLRSSTDQTTLTFPEGRSNPF